MPADNSKFDIAIIIITANDQKNIGRLLDQIYLQDFSMDKVELVVVDSFSTDETRQTVESYKDRFGSFKLLDNPARTKSAGWNIGVKNSGAPYIMTIDGRTSFPGKDIIKNTLELFKSTNSDCLCRPQPLAPPDANEFQMAAGYCRSSAMGHRPGMEIEESFEGPVDPTASGFCYARKVFDSVGYFDESFDGCEDIELNYRIGQGGLASYLTPKLTQYYYPPETPKKMWLQMYRYGKGRFRFARKHNEYSIMQWLAGFGVALFLFLGIMAFFSHATSGLFRQFCVVYVIVIALFSIYLAAKREFLGILLWGLIVFPIIHFGLGFGFLREFFSYASKN